MRLQVRLGGTGRAAEGCHGHYIQVLGLPSRERSSHMLLDSLAHGQVASISYKLRAGDRLFTRPLPRERIGNSRDL